MINSNNLNAMPCYFLTVSLCLILSFGGFAQTNPPTTPTQIEAAYAWRVKQDMLYGVYIPRDLGEAFVQLTRLSEAPGREQFLRLSEQQAVTLPFFGLGRWISLNWGFYEGSRLTVYLNELGLYHPDDMTRFVLVMYHRYLNKKPLNPQPVIAGFLDMRRTAETTQKLRGQVLSEETRKREVPKDAGGG